ncbi:biotin--[acetyl-CoA-carboxylase] ligase [Geothrix campi]|uniref:biotin--[acetyl-CoA-carboxylase] ligase n=1 Tax=Geothrix campi TaxID=2966450 RepID=UPI00214913D0|nr:biotin--[acetyl-CoA-carboxylase] ligase [Geothrix sp. SG10]
MTLPLIHLAEVDSTQAFLRRNPHLGFCAVLADCQTEGRGRQGNRWESAAGAGLWLSAMLPAPSGVAPGVVLQRAMTAAASVLDPEGEALGLKWPNDLVAWKASRLVKVGGILGEQIGGRLILGLGVNLAKAPDLPDRSIPPACLAELGLSHPSSRSLATHITQLWSNLAQDLQPLFRWPETGVFIHWEDGQGTCLGWEPDGRLKVATAEGIRRLSAGEISGMGQGT